MIPDMPVEELKKLAVDYKESRIFTHLDIHNINDTSMVFMPIALMRKEDLEKLKASDPGLIYEHISEAGPRAINGMPMFMSFHSLNQEDTKRLFEMVGKLQAAEQEALKAIG